MSDNEDEEFLLHVYFWCHLSLPDLMEILASYQNVKLLLRKMLIPCVLQSTSQSCHGELWSIRECACACGCVRTHAFHADCECVCTYTYLHSVIQLARGQ